MNTIFQLCPKCNKHTNILLNDDNVHINCECGNNSIMTLNTFINQFNHNKSNNNPNDKEFTDISNDINKGFEHLLTYFKEVKDDQITYLLGQINKIKSSYEDSFNRNLNMLSYIKILIDNYDGSIEKKNSILNNKINIYKCEENVNADDLIKYYNEYSIIEMKKINIEEVECIKTITDHTSTSNVNSLLLKDKRIASCSLYNIISIYDPSNDYHCDKVIKRHSKVIESICELDDGTIVSCSEDKSIIIGDYTIKKAHDKGIIKVISLPNNRIASCSFDNTIKIWKSNPPYRNIPIIVLEGHKLSVYSLLYIKERDMMISGTLNAELGLWNMSTYQCKTVIKGVACHYTNSLYQIDKDRVIVGGFTEFSIVNIDKYVIEKKIKDKSLEAVQCFIKLRDNHTILCGCGKGQFCLYDLNTEEYKTTENNHKREIYDLLVIDDNTFLSCSCDKTLKVWKY